MSGRLRGRGPAGLLEVARDLSARDQAVLRSLRRHRFHTTAQLERLLFIDHASPLSAARASRRVLRQLEHRQLVTRLPRQVGGLHAGSASSIWYLAPAGHRLLSLLDGHGAHTRVREPSSFFLRHALAVAQAHLDLIEADRQGRSGLAEVQIEQESWRSYLGPGGSREQLKPDLAVVTTSGEFEDSWFIEVDLGTEHLPTLLRKCQQYETYRRLGSEQLDRGVFPVVVWTVTSDERADRLQTAITASRSLDSSLFRVCRDNQLPAVMAEETT